MSPSRLLGGREEVAAPLRGVVVQMAAPAWWPLVPPLTAWGLCLTTP